MEVVIVDDNSPDGTQDVVKELINIYGGDKVVLHARPGKMGLGSAYIDGLKKCKGEYVVLMDADLSHHVSAFSNIVKDMQIINQLLFMTFSQNSSQSSLTKWNQPAVTSSLEPDTFQVVECMDGISIER